MKNWNKNIKIIIVPNVVLIFIGIILIQSCESTQPSLCDCLTKSEYAQYGDSKYKQCEEVFLNKYGTKEPSNNQMRNDYYRCKE